jgi:hypothetical protein
MAVFFLTNDRMLWQDLDNLVPFSRPENYDASEWELLRRYINSCAELIPPEESRHAKKFHFVPDANALLPEDFSPNAKSLDPICKIGYPSCSVQRGPSNKFDMNNCGAISTDLIGGSWDYPLASYEQRKDIYQKHRNYMQGLIWTMQSDPDIPEFVRNQTSAWGLCRDEFLSTNNWPPWLYVREARRMVSDEVFTQNTISIQRQQIGGIGNLSIGVGGYNFDSHNTQRFKCDNTTACFGAQPSAVNATGAFFWNEGDVEIGPGDYQIPFWILLPPENEASNFLVVAAPSASHIGISTLRMEPQFMMLGQAAGAAAVIAIQEQTSVQRIPLNLLNEELLKGGAILDCLACHD